MEILYSIASVTWNVLLVILGINALIIVHEFGHFLVARWCGVRCDKFYIWFDVGGFRFFRFKWGDTEYGLGWLPLGGYVKMFGQEDNPGQARAEMERAKLAAVEAAEAPDSPVEGETSRDEDREVAAKDFPDDADETPSNEDDPEHVPTLADVERMEKTLYAPDSYLAKSVPQRMAIIVAGVVMNIIFAFICATGAYMIGFKESAPAVGAVIPGSPAWQSGLQCGDRIVEINGKKAVKFADITTTLLADGALDLKIAREGEPELIEKHVSSWKKGNDLVLSVGIRGIGTTDLVPLKTLKKALPDRYINRKAKDYTPIYPDVLLDQLERFPEGCTVIRVDGTNVGSYAEIERLMKRNSDKPLTLQIVDTKTGTADSEPHVETLELPPVPMKFLNGCRLQMGPVTALLKDGSAEKVGVEPGDTIIAVDGERDLDPLRLPYRMRQKSNAGQETAEVTVRKADGGEKTYEISLIPDAVRADPMSPQDVMGCPTLGISYEVPNRLAGPDAEKGRIVKVTLLEKPRRTSWGFWYTSDLTFRGTSFYEETQDGPAYIDVGGKIAMPVLLFDVLQGGQIRPGMSLRFHFAKDEEPEDAQAESVTAVPAKDSDGKTEEVFLDFEVAESDDWFMLDRNLPFMPDLLTVKVPFPQACVNGAKKTVESAMLVYLTLRNLGTRVSMKGMGGPVMIVKFAYGQASGDFSGFLIFLCLISANLAVLNILPIPVLDGGHLVFLAYEGITGKQPNPVVFEILCWIGLLLLLTLMVWVCLLDFGLVKRL